MRAATFALLISLAGAYACAQGEASPDKNVVLRVSLPDDRQVFHIGEIVPLELSFTSAVLNRYQVNTAQYDRSGRMAYEQFSVTPAEGAVDPLPNYRFSMGGLMGLKYLGADPWTIKLNLNEWVRFIRPGEYRVTVTSGRAGVKDPANPFGVSAVAVRGNELAIKIVSASPSWQQAVFDRATATLDRPAPVQPQDIQDDLKARREAMEVLRFLGTPEAIRELAKRMRGEDTNGLDSVCQLGLIGAPDPQVARQALQDALADPNHPINGVFLSTLQNAGAEPRNNDEPWEEQQKKAAERRQRAAEQLIAVLPAKRGKALAVSLGTAVDEAWNGATLSQQTSEKLVQQLVAMFDQLPPPQQNLLLTYRWDKIAGPAMLPMVRRYAQLYPTTNEAAAREAAQASGSALRHWYELDPEGARPAIISEIARPRPRYDVRVLGILPDKTLPEVDAALAEHLIASADYQGTAALAALIARYGSDNVLSQVLETLDPRIGKWPCAIQNPLLAYVLRVNPSLARPRIEQAIAARGKGFTACNHELFQSISEIVHRDPVLEDIAIHSLDDPDPQVAMTAATMLGAYGSPAAEPVLWERFTQWAAKWRGRESELDTTIADGIDRRTWEAGLGENLMRALAEGRSWLADEGKLQRLSQLTKATRLHQEFLDPYLKLWSDQPLTVSLNYNIAPLDAHVAQYEFHSIADLEDKLAQFPRGTKFVLSVLPADAAESDPSRTELCRFMAAHGMVVAAEKNAD
jgi:hypothetical protein